ncbi:hypothetical protein MiSe_73100 [Microseira wollei NIES-4236]|uniref:YggT family protein n=1 Tax=Microseira wollei NIES-4236 TaxID=2530354 RepID=A0AAV3XRU5_9CYAN|nr:hypothetical protein MiSe_73100 [Microseira wollei NIES-4236]
MCQTQSRVSLTQSRVFEPIAAGVELIVRVVVVIVRVFLAGFLHRQIVAAAIIAVLREIVGVTGYTLPQGGIPELSLLVEIAVAVILPEIAASAGSPVLRVINLSNLL